jgi:hypothetical protein
MLHTSEMLIKLIHQKNDVLLRCSPQSRLYSVCLSIILIRKYKVIPANTQLSNVGQYKTHDREVAT